MKLYTETNDFKLYQGNMLDMLEAIQPNSIDSIITDPPYGLTSITKRFGSENSAPNVYGKDGSFARLTKGFMGKAWDGSGIEYNVEAWRKKNAKVFSVQCNIDYDADIIEHLQAQPNKQRYIINLIRKDIEKGAGK